MEGTPIDLLLGSMSSELYHLIKTVLPQEVGALCFRPCVRHVMFLDVV